MRVRAEYAQLTSCALYTFRADCAAAAHTHILRISYGIVGLRRICAVLHQLCSICQSEPVKNCPHCQTLHCSCLASVCEAAWPVTKAEHNKKVPTSAISSGQADPYTSIQPQRVSALKLFRVEVQQQNRGSKSCTLEAAAAVGRGSLKRQQGEGGSWSRGFDGFQRALQVDSRRAQPTGPPNAMREALMKAKCVVGLKSLCGSMRHSLVQQRTASESCTPPE